MIKPDVILWDWDNTLIDSRRTAARALRRLGDETNITVSDSDVSEVIGGHLVDFWYRNYGSDPIPAVEKFLAYYRLYAPEVKPFSEAIEVLSWVQHIKIPQIVVSNKNQDILDPEAEKFGLTRYFQRIVGTKNHGDAKPSRAYADKTLGPVWPKHILMIGDGQSDMEFARTIGAFGLLIHDSDTPPFPCDKMVHSLAEAFVFLKQESLQWEN